MSEKQIKYTKQKTKRKGENSGGRGVFGVLVTFKRKVLDVLGWRVFNMRNKRRDHKGDGKICGKLGKDDTIIF